MGYILSIETSGSVCSVAIHQEGKLLTQRVSQEPKSHAALLHPFIQETLQASKLTLHDLRAVAISGGPGSYTGLRIGTSAAKGICFALDLPLIAISSLEALALISFLNLGSEDKKTILALMDARRLEVYAALYEIAMNQKTPNIVLLEGPMPQILDQDNWIEGSLAKRPHLAGDGAWKTKNHFYYPEELHDTLSFPSAEAIGILAWKKFIKSEFEDPAYFSPDYLKPFYSPPPKK